MEAAGRRRWWALIALVPAILAVALDATVLSVALPTLAGSLHASTNQLQWFFVAYTLVFAAAMLPGGMLGDRFGRKRVLLIALAVFGVGSIACAASPSAGVFIGARAVLGLGGAVVLPMVLAVVPVFFSEEERPKAVALVMAVTMLGYPIGPILGGWLLTNYWWGWVFLMNVPMVGLALLAAGLWLPESRSARPQRLDLVGVLASSGGVALLTYGVIGAGQNGWGDVTALLEMTAGVCVLGAFAAWERRTREPLVDLRLFRSPGFTWGTVLSTAVSFALFGILFAMPLYFQEVRGNDPMGSGVRLLPMIGGLIAGAGVSDALVKKASARVTSGLGFALLGVGFVVGSATSTTSGDGFAALWLAVAGLGVGLVMPTAMDAALGALSGEHSGVGSALIQALRMVGGTFGAAILGSVLNSAYQGRVSVTGLSAPLAATVREGVSAGVAVARSLRSTPLLDSVRAAFVGGLDTLLWVCVGIAAVSCLLGVTFMPGRLAAPKVEPRRAAGRGGAVAHEP